MMAPTTIFNTSSSSTVPFIHQAASSGNIKAAKMMVEEDDGIVDSVDSYTGKTPIHYAAANGHKAFVSFLLSVPSPTTSTTSRINARDDGGETALSLAARSGRCDVVALLLRRGADGGAVDHDGRTVLMMALMMTTTTTTTISSTRKRHDKAATTTTTTTTTTSSRSSSTAVVIDMVKCLLSDETVKRTIKMRDVYGQTTLWYATYYQLVDVMLLLVSKWWRKVVTDSDYGLGGRSGAVSWSPPPPLPSPPSTPPPVRYGFEL